MKITASRVLNKRKARSIKAIEVRTRPRIGNIGTKNAIIRQPPAKRLVPICGYTRANLIPNNTYRSPLTSTRFLGIMR